MPCSGTGTTSRSATTGEAARRLPDGGRVVVVSSAVADVVAFLCSDVGRWMTGAVLDATGGLR